MSYLWAGLCISLLMNGGCSCVWLDAPKCCGARFRQSTRAAASWPWWCITWYSSASAIRSYGQSCARRRELSTSRTGRLGCSGCCCRGFGARRGASIRWRQPGVVRALCPRRKVGDAAHDLGAAAAGGWCVQELSTPLGDSSTAHARAYLRRAGWLYHGAGIVRGCGGGEG